MIKFTITYRPQLSKRGMNRVLRAAYGRIGQVWVDQMLPKHFTKKGAAEYNYAPRAGEQYARGSKAYKRSYTGNKERRRGHTDPLVWSGKTRDQAKSAASRPSNTKIRIHLPVGHLYKNPKSRTDPRDEILRVSEAERAKLTRLFDRELQRELNHERTLVRKRIR